MQSTMNVGKLEGSCLDNINWFAFQKGVTKKVTHGDFDLGWKKGI